MQLGSYSDVIAVDPSAADTYLATITAETDVTFSFDDGPEIVDVFDVADGVMLQLNPSDGSTTPLAAGLYAVDLLATGGPIAALVVADGAGGFTLTDPDSEPMEIGFSTNVTDPAAALGNSVGTITIMVDGPDPFIAPIAPVASVVNTAGVRWMSMI